MSGLPAKNRPIDTELLLARLEVKDYFLHRAVRDIYDNIGQVLSLVMVNLGRIQRVQHSENMEVTEQTIALVSQSIRDLRSMASLFAPESRLQTVDDFLALTKEQLKLHFPGGIWQEADGKETRITVAPDLLIALFSIIIMLFDNIRDSNMTALVSMRIHFSIRSVRIDCKYPGENVEVPSIVLAARLDAIGGRVRQVANVKGLRSVNLTIPLNHQT